MTRLIRFLTDDHPSPHSSVVHSDYVVILAALLCALICVLGLLAVARCTCLRRLRISSAASVSPPPPPLPAPNKGLKKKVLRSLPKLTATAEYAVKLSDCAICLTEFAAGEEIRVLPHCGHGFHVSCIDTWLKSNSSCPSCRQILTVSRCQKCGGFPASTSSKVMERENDGNRFLP